MHRAHYGKLRGIHAIVKLTHYCGHHEAIARRGMQKRSE